MIDSYDIETKDFSCVLPKLINQLVFVADGILAMTDSNMEASKKFLFGACATIQNIADDLEVIDAAINPPAEGVAAG